MLIMRVAVIATVILSASIKAQIIVSNTNDSGAGSLRAAIESISSNTADPTIVFETNLSGSTITLTSGQLLLDESMIIDASALADGIIIDASGNHRILEIEKENAVTLNRLTLTGGVTDSAGGGIRVNATIADITTNLTLNECNVSGNMSRFGGAGISVTSSRADVILALNRSTISGNSIDPNGGLNNPNGGGVAIEAGRGAVTLTLNECTVAENNGINQGGGIYINCPRGTVALGINNSTIVNNIANLGSSILNNSTLATSVITLNNSILAGNSGSDIIEFGEPSELGDGPTLILSGVNFIKSYDGDPEPGFSPNNLIGSVENPIDPLLSSVGSVGGPTQSVFPLPGSPVINAGESISTESTDQRGQPRAVNLPREIGAIELQGVNEFASRILNAFWLTDEDGDEIPFGLEFALGTDPQSFTPVGAAIPSLSLDGAGNLAISVTVAPRAENKVAWTIETSTDLQSWPASETLISGQLLSGTATFPINTDTSRRFYRYSVVPLNE